MKLSGMQKIVKWFTGDQRFNEMMSESKLWRFTCECGVESSIWQIGGIRYKAKGNPSKLIRCPHCNKTGMQNIYKIKAHA